jgi:hypothetical protein
MFEESKYLSLDELREINDWACSWYDKAIDAGFIQLSHKLDDEILGRLHSYFKAGLSPAEAADAAFRKTH